VIDRRSACVTVVALVVCVGWLTGCGGSDDEASGAAGDSGLPLEGTAWSLSTSPGPDGEQVSVPADVPVTARFVEGGLSGSGGCNDYSAGYRLDGSNLTIDPVATTLKACPDPAGSVESGYLAALEQVVGFRTDQTSLTLVDADGETLLTFGEAEQAALIGTSWVATGVNNGKGGLASVIADSEITAVLSENDEVSGSSGCNDFTGPFTADDDGGIDIGPLASTRKACPEPPGVDEQETAFLAAMDRATRYSIDGTTLELRDDEGALQASFEAASG
jgi:heat shock protein HslJ